MTTMNAAITEFNEDYAKIMERLEIEHEGNEALAVLRQAEAFRENSGSDDYAPEWLRPFVEITAQILKLRLEASEFDAAALMIRLTPVVARAVQLGYTEGYFAGKDD